MYGYMMVIPAEGDQIVRIGSPTVSPGDDMMDLDAIGEGTALHGAATIPVEDMTTQLAGNRPLSTSQIERFPGFGHPDHFDVAVTEDLFEGSGSDPGTGQDTDPGLTTGFCRSPGVDDHCHIGWYRCRVRTDIETVLTDRHQPQSPAFGHRQTLIARDDLIGPLIHCLFQDPSVQPGQSTPKASHQLVIRPEMDISVTRLAFPSPGQSLVFGHQTTQPMDVVPHMRRTDPFGQPGDQLRPIKAHLPLSQRFGHLGSLHQPGRSPTQSPGRLMR